MAPIERIVLAHRLREVVAQLGFTRFEAVGTDVDGDLEVGVEAAAIALDLSWLPDGPARCVFLSGENEATVALTPAYSHQSLLLP